MARGAVAVADHQHSHGGTQAEQGEPILSARMIWIDQQQRIVVEKHAQKVSPNPCRDRYRCVYFVPSSAVAS